MGGFSNGYVPLFIIVGFQNKVYYDNNYTNWESALQLAIDEMVAEGVFIESPVPDKIFLFGQTTQIDVSNVFKDVNDNTVTVTVESNSTSSVAAVTVAENILTVTASGFEDGSTVVILKGTAGEFSATDEFKISVYDPSNYNIEDFETGDFTNMNWEFSGNTGWSIDNTVFYEGSYSARSNDISDNQKAEMLMETDYPTAGKILFKAKASSELIYDNLKFYIDNVEKKKISGQTSWQAISFDVEAGAHIFKWSYQKDASATSYSDCAWVDYITLEGGRMTGIESSIAPEDVALYQNYPNPFNPSTKISFSLTEPSEVSLSVFNQKGELVSRLYEGKLEKGDHSYDFNGSDLASGIYFYGLKTKNNSLIRKMIMLK